MGYTIGIDTSNYTTSVAVYDIENNSISMTKKLLPVKDGELGLRQSDALFAHVNQLGDLFNELFSNLPKQDYLSVGASLRPRTVEGSYMPCFLVGDMVAKAISSVLHTDLYEFSHQDGHIMAALFSADAFDLINEDFYAFHISGGTTEMLLVSKGDENKAFNIELIGHSLDLKAGQAVDRVGKLLGLPFPAGPKLDLLSQKCDEEIKVKPTIKGLDCCLSGIENQAKALLDKSYSLEYIAKFCIKSIESAITAMITEAFKKYGKKQILFAGGVMSNSIIKASLTDKFYDYAHFAKPQFSADNAAGIAILAAIKYGERNGRE